MSVSRKMIGTLLVAGVLAALSGVHGFAAEERKGNVDLNHSNVGFEVPIFGGISLVKGKFGDFWTQVDVQQKDGVLHLNKIEAVIQATSVDTGIDQRDVHLRLRDFLVFGNFLRYGLRVTILTQQTMGSSPAVRSQCVESRRRSIFQSKSWGAT